MKKILSLLLLSFFIAHPAHALNGLMVGKDDAPIASATTKIIIATHNGHHTLTMLPDISSSVRDVALLIPVPASVTAQNIREVSASLFDAVDTLSAPRLREEYDTNPCTAAQNPEIKTYAVTAKHAADNTSYDISVLPADQAAGLVKWLASNGYKIPRKSERFITPYTQRGLAFVLAKARRNSNEDGYLKPLQISYDAPQLVMPVRLGLINAPAKIEPPRKGKEAIVYESEPDRNTPRTPEPVDVFNDAGQSLTLYVITQQGRAISPVLRSIPISNPRMDTDLPSYVTRDFPSIYNRMLNLRAKAEGNALLVEFAGEAQLPADILSAVGVNWLNEKPTSTIPPATFGQDENNLIGAMMLPKAAMPKHLQRTQAATGKPYLTRLYTRYNAATLPQDIGITESNLRDNENLRFSTHVVWQPDASVKDTCDITHYQQSLATRLAHEEQNMSRLTGWSIAVIREKMRVQAP